MTDLEQLERLVHLNFAGFFRDSLGFSADSLIHEEHGFMLWAGATEFPVMANGVLRLDDARPATEMFEVAKAFFGERGRGYTWFTRDLDLDAGLEKFAQEHEWMRVVDMPEMVCSQRVESKDVSSDITLRRVEDADGVGEFARMNAQAYATIGMPADEMLQWFARPEGVLEPHLCAVLAYLDGEPVSGAMANLSHGIGGVYWVGTVPAARGQALADRCTRSVTNWAFDEGARVVSLQASAQGEPIYRAMGYEDRFRYFGYLVPPG